MERLRLDGVGVVEQLSEPCEYAESRVAFLLAYVKGEYEDEDGDWASGFIIADPKPSEALQNLNGTEPREQGSDVPVMGTEAVDVNGSAKESVTQSLSADCSMGCEDGSGMGYKDGSGFVPTCFAEDTPSNAIESSVRKAKHEMTFGDRDESMVVQITNRKRHLDSADLSYQSDESEEGIFFCELCRTTLPLNSVYPMLSCDCLLCISCCRLHVETSLLHAIKRGGRHGNLVSGQNNRRRPDKRANSASVAKNGIYSGVYFGDTHVVEVNVGNCRQEEIVTVGEEQGLKLYVDLFPQESESCIDFISCPTASCNGRLQLSGAQILAPEAFRQWEEAASQDLMEQCTSYINCPGCDIVIEKVLSDIPPGVALSGVPEFDRTLPFIELDSEGKQLSRTALWHRAVHRFRCSMCSVDFCGQCMNVPYHLGKSCEELEEEKNAIKCLYCAVPIRSLRQDEKVLYSVKELRKEVDRQKVDALWCMEKRDLVAVQRFTSLVCTSKECRKLLQAACTRDLDCGHHCGGVRGERLCLSCLEDECRQKVSFRSGGKHLPSADDLCSICLVEPLRRAPSIQLNCGHIVHIHCARRKLEGGCPGPGISFGYLNCPQCPELMQHSSLSLYLQKPLRLREQVKEKALRRLKMEGLCRSAKELKAGGQYAGNPVEFALQLYRYYICSKCNAPYFGGLRECAEINREEMGSSHNPLDLVCGGCSAASGGQGLCKRGHGKEFVEFKCKFCCSIASYFCFGHIHFCESCHTTRPDLRSNFIPVKCMGPNWCPLHIAHAPNGQECCLGCSMCRLRGQ